MRLTRRDAAILAAAFALALLHALWFRHTCDDAYISFRYARHLVRGSGLVFNPGEYVMGYSNLLWVLLLAGAESIGVAAPSAARLLGVIFAWATLAYGYDHLRRGHDRHFAALAGIALLVANGTFGVWMFGGLEGHLLALLLLVAVGTAIRISPDSSASPFLGLGVLLGLASLTRPEGGIYALPIAAWLLARRPTRDRLARVGLFLGVAALFGAGLVVWSTFYYGDPLSNTAHAKLLPFSGRIVARGSRIAWWFLAGFLGAPALAIVLWGLGARPGRRASGWLFLSVIATFLLFFVRIGGDALVYYRMWIVVLPMFALLAAEGLAGLREAPRYGRAAATLLALALVVLNVQHSFVGREIGRLRRDDRFVRDALLIGEALRGLPPSTLVAANNVGALAWASGLPVLDMLGLTDRRIARAPNKDVSIPGHECHDGRYVLDRRPDLVFYAMPRAYPTAIAEDVVRARAYPSDRDLDRDPRFAAEYRLTHLRLADGRYVPFYRRLDAR